MCTRASFVSLRREPGKKGIEEEMNFNLTFAHRQKSLPGSPLDPGVGLTPGLAGTFRFPDLSSDQQ